MKLVSLFVQGGVDAATAFVNENGLTDAFVQLLPGALLTPYLVDGDPVARQATTLGHYVVVRVSDARARKLEVPRDA